MADDEKTTTAVVIETPANGDANRAETKEATTPPESKPKGEHAPAGETGPKAEVEKIVQARLQAERDGAAKKQEKDRKDAVAAALKEQGDWQKLADARQAEADEANRKLAELEPALTTTSAERDRYKAALEKNLEAQKKGLPDHILSLMGRLDPADQLEYLAENAEVIKAAAPAPEPEVKPNGSTPARRTSTTTNSDSKPQLPLPSFPLA